MLQLSFLMPKDACNGLHPSFWLPSPQACPTSTAKYNLNDNSKTFMWLQHFPFPSSKKLNSFCFVYSGNSVAWVLLMIYAPFSSRTLENYLEDMNTKLFLHFLIRFQLLWYMPSRDCRRGGWGKGLLWYIGIHMEKISISHTSDSIQCTHL